MSSKPGVFALSKESTLFAFSNVKIFFNHIKVVFPLILLCGIVKQAGKLQGLDWMPYVIMVCTLFLYSCFALAWHRTCLQGPDKAHERNPVNISGDDWKFIGLFFGVSFLFGAYMEGLNQIVNLLPEDQKGISALGGVAVLIAMGFAMLMFLRASFLFPARSVGVKLTWKEAKRASKGLVWPLIGTNIIFGMIFVVAFSVYAFIVGFIVTVARGGVKPNRMEGFLTDLLLSIPILMAAFFLVALCITALSRAYQWGIQNND